ncbi:MAG: TonB-dependent receptor [Bacteroidota bacterium]
MKKFSLLSFMLMFTVVSGNLWAQERTVSGKVTSVEDGSALPGVNVILKGTASGAVTDIDGNYRLFVPSDGGTLVFSFIGLASEEVEIGARSVIDLQMSPDVQQLSEVVITGYGNQPKRSVTGSIAQVKGEVIENMPVQSFDRALQGRAAGVQIQSASGAPGGAIEVRIRGIGSITGGNDPLYVVDGVQISQGDNNTFGSGNALNAINPNDIESIEILKDASASAIYGAQAANGVVLITTKRGKKGKASINFSAQYGQIEAINKIDVLNADQFVQLRTEAITNRRGLNFDPDPDFGDRTTAEYVAESLYPINGRTNWVDEVFRTGTSQIYDLSLSGGSDNTTYYISGSYNNQEGHVIASDFERATLKVNLTTQVDDHLTIEPKISISTFTQNGTIADGAFINSPHFASLFVAPYEPVFDEEGEYNQVLPAPFNYNVVAMSDFNERVTTTNQLIGSLALNYKIKPWLSARVFGGLDHADMNEYNWRDPRIVNNQNFGGRRNQRDRRITNFNINGTVNFNKRINDVHGISALVGTEYREQNWETISTAGEGFNNFNLRTLNDANGPASAVAAIGSFNTSWNIASFFGSANYDYNEKYYASFTFRRDGSSRFGTDTRWGNFYSGSLSWRISQEDFFSNVTFVDELKLRASLGQTGNSLLDPNGTQNFQALAAWASIGNYSDVNGTIVGGNFPDELGNSELTWEVNEQWNFGIDYALFGGRVSGAVDYFIADRQDLLLEKPLPVDSGWPEILTNVGTVRNKGIEVELTTVNLDKGGFKWETSFNITFIDNEVIELFDGEETIGNTIRVGEPLQLNWYPTALGVNPATGRQMWLDEQGNPTYALQGVDSKIQGDQQPDFFGGLANTISYKGFSLDFFFQYDYGRDILNNNAFFHEASGGYGWNQATSQLDRWQQPGDITSVPRPYDGVAEPGTTRSNEFSTRQIEDASYIRLKQVTLAYDFSPTLINKIGVDRARIFLQGINLWTITEYTGWDPEILNVDIGAYPQGLQYTVGVQLGF